MKFEFQPTAIREVLRTTHGRSGGARGVFARGNFSAATIREYEARWRDALGRELAVGVWFRRLAGRVAPGTWTP